MSGRPQDVVWEHGDNLYPGFRCKYCNTVKAGGGATRFKQHLTGWGSSVVQKCAARCAVVFQRDLERARKQTADSTREKLRREEAAAAGNNPTGEYDEEEELQRAMNQSRAEEEYRQSVSQRGGAYEHGGGSRAGGSGSAGLNPLQRMLRRAGSRRDTIGVLDRQPTKGSTRGR
jgi:hypothetical protein